MVVHVNSKLNCFNLLLTPPEPPTPPSLSSRYSQPSKPPLPNRPRTLCRAASDTRHQIEHLTQTSYPIFVPGHVASPLPSPPLAALWLAMKSFEMLRCFFGVRPPAVFDAVAFLLAFSTGLAAFCSVLGTFLSARKAEIALPSVSLRGGRTSGTLGYSIGIMIAIAFC